MSSQIPLRITVIGPPSGVKWAVQGGRSELIPPTTQTDTQITFDLSVRVGRAQADGAPTLLGLVAQGPPAGRFIYVNSGTLAGQADSCWTRRAKVPLGIATATV